MSGRRAANERLLAAVAGRSGINSARWIEQARFRRQYRVLLRDIARPDFRPDTRSIAVSRGMTVDGVNLALQRLLRLDLVEMRGAVWIALKEAPWEIR